MRGLKASTHPSGSQCSPQEQRYIAHCYVLRWVGTAFLWNLRCANHTQRKRKKCEKEREGRERERRGGFLPAERFVSHSYSAEKISWDGGGLLTLSADLYLLGPAWYQQAPWLQIGLVGAVRYSKKTNTDQNQTHIKMSLNTATFDPSPQAWQSGTKEGNQEVSNISCLWLLEEGKSE